MIEAKKILVDLVKKSIKEEKDLTKQLGQRQSPDKKEKVSSDIVDIMTRLDEKDKSPVILMTSADFKAAPVLQNSEDDLESFGGKLRVLEHCIINLAEKVSEYTKSIKDDIKSLKPTYIDKFKATLAEEGNLNSNDVKQSEGARFRNMRAQKRSRSDEEGAYYEREDDGERDSSVFEDAFQTQRPRRGFRNDNRRNERENDRFERRDNREQEVNRDRGNDRFDRRENREQDDFNRKATWGMEA